MKKRFYHGSMGKLYKCTSRFLMLGLVALLAGSVAARAQTVVNSLAELEPYLDDDNVHVKLAPGTYSITAADVTEGRIGSTSETWSRVSRLFAFKGNNSVYDFTGVKFEIDTEVLRAFGGQDVYELHITGNENVIKNLTIEDIGNNHPINRATSIVVDGRANRLEGFHMTVRGSFPYGYGDAFGKGGGPVIAHQKHSALLVRGESNHIKGCTIIHRSYGHAIFMQAASNPLIEGCYVEGEMRTTDDMLAEEGTGSPADKVNFMTEWGYRLPAGYMLSLGEGGIRAYNAGETTIDGVEYSRGTSNPTVLNCTIKNMRTGVVLAHATGKKYVEGTTVIGCESGFSLGSGDVVDCKADATYGPVYASTYESDRDYNADITILPASDPYYNGSGSLAYIGGSGHKITLRGTEEALNMGLKIKVGGDKNDIRLLYGNLPHQNDFTASNFELNNLTNFPVLLSSKSSGVTGKSGGMVTDLGTNNNLLPVSVSVKKLEAEAYTAMSGITMEATTDENNGENVTSFDTGDWVAYEIDVPYSGTYTMNYRVASASTGGSFSLNVGDEKLEDITFPATSGGQTWTTVSSTTPFYLEEGTQTIKVSANSAGWNLNWLDLLLDCAVVPVVPHVEKLNNLSISLGKAQSNSITAFPGNTVSLQPEPALGGSWSWTGPNGFTASSRIINIKDLQESKTGTYQVTFTNDCGQQSTATFNVHVQGALTVEAESYSDMSGVETAATTDQNGGEMITSVQAGDWVEYTLNVPISGTYGLSFRVASANDISFDLSLDGNASGNVSIASTGGLQSWSTANAASDLYLPAGEHTLRITSNTAGWNMNWLQLQSKAFVNPCSLPFTYEGFAIQNETVEWSSGLIDISCVNSINAYLTLNEKGNLTTSDYINIYYRLDGGEKVAISEENGSLDENVAIARQLTGKTLELIVTGNSGSMENFYIVSDITILETTDPFARIEAENYDDVNGAKVGNTGDVDGVRNLGSIKPGHWSMYAGLDLTDVKSIKARVASIYTDAFVEVRLNAPDGQLIGTVDVPQTGAWQTYATAKAYIEDVTGVYNVYLVYKTKASANVCNINWFQFSDEFVAPPIDPYVRFEAENYNGQSGTSIANTSDVDGKKDVNNIQNGDWIKFSSLNISEASSVDLRVAGISNNAQIELRLDAVDGPVVAFVDVPNTGSLSTWKTISTQVDEVDGEHDIYLLFTGQGENLLRLNWLQFKVYENPFARIEAESYDAKEWKKGTVGGTSDAEDKGVGSILKSIVPGDWIMFNNVDLTGAKSISARFGSLYDDAHIEVRTGSADGALIGTINLYNSGGWHNWQTISTNLKKVTGSHDLYFIFKTETSPNVCNINWFQLSGQGLEEKDPYARIEAEDFDLADGTKTESTTDADGGQNVGTIQDGNWLLFKSLDLSDAGGILTRVASINDGGTIELRLGSSTGTQVGTVNVPNTGGWQNWETVKAEVDAVEGVHDLYLVFKGESSYLFNINWLQFINKPVVIGDSTRIEAEAYFTQSGVRVQATSDVDGDEHLSLINGGDNITFDLDVLSEGIYNVSFRVSPKTSGSSIVIRKDDGTTAEVMVPDAGEGEEWQTVSTYLKLSAGVQSLSFEFAGAGSNLFNLNWVSFELTGLGLQLMTKTTGSATDNSIKTDFEIVNTGADAINLDDLTVRYWFTAEEYASLNFWCDYAQIGKQNVAAVFKNSSLPRAGGLTYVELSFTDGMALNAKLGTGEIRTRLAKSDWTAFNETDDYSFMPSKNMIENNRVTMYLGGSLVWGEEPEVMQTTTSIVVEHKAGDASKPHDNTLKPQFNISNTGNVAVALSDVKVRYWFTAEGPEAMNFWLDWAELGQSKVSGVVYTLDAPTASADRYLELSFNSADTLYSLSSTGEIRTRLAKSDWSAFDETNDHSYIGTKDYQANPQVTVYVKGELVYGTEPTGALQTGVVTAVKAGSMESPRSMQLYPNPVKEKASLNVTLEEAGKVEFTILTLAGQRVRSEVKALPHGEQEVKVDVQGLTEGIYLLQIRSREVNAVLRFVKTN